MTWHGSSLYIIDPILGQLVAWYAMDTGKNEDFRFVCILELSETLRSKNAF